MSKKIEDLLEKITKYIRPPYRSNPVTDRILQKTGGRGLYAKHEIDLSVAHADFHVPIDGDILTVENCPSAVTVKMNHIRNPEIDLLEMGEVEGSFKNLFINNVAGEGTLKFFTGDKGMFKAKKRHSGGIKFKLIDLSSSVQVNSGGGTETQTLQPNPGYLYEIIDIDCLIPDPVGSSAVSHQLTIKNHDDNLLANMQSTFGSVIAVYYGGFQCTTESPTATYQQNLIHGGFLKCSNSRTLKFTYTNSTDAHQTGTRKLKILVKETVER